VTAGEFFFDNDEERKRARAQAKRLWRNVVAAVLLEDVLQELIASEPQAVVEYPSDDWRAIAYLEIERPYAPRY
jgi:hypothetical protein